MKLEDKVALGWVLREYRDLQGWSQEMLAERSGVSLRSIQRAEVGDGIGKFNLGVLAKVFGVEVAELRRKAASCAPPSPDKRIPLKRLNTGTELLDVLELCKSRGWTLETGPLDEHRYNEMLGEDIQMLAEDLDQKARSEDERIGRVRNAQAILTLSRKLGFWLFAGNYTEELPDAGGRRRRKGTLIIAAPMRDPRIVRTAKGPVLDVIRDSRRMLLGAALAGHGTTYDWLEDQLIGKSDGEFRVKNEFRRIMSEVTEEMNQAEEKARKGKRSTLTNVP